MKRNLIVSFLAAALAGLPAFAQMPGGGMGRLPGMNPALTQLFGKTKAFTATADFNVQNPRQKIPMVMTMNFSMSDGKVRTDMDMTQMKGANIPPQALASMKQTGMDKMVNIARPDKKVTYVVYPGLNAYVETPMPPAQAAATEKDFKIEKTSLGKETIDGHDCEKSKVVMTDAQGATHEILVWNAPDLKDFPVQMQMTENGSTTVITYKNVKLEEPSAALFEPPAGLTKYDNQMTLMQTEMAKRAGGN